MNIILASAGRAINFSHGAVRQGRFPLLSSVSGSNHSALVSFAHESTSEGSTSMNGRCNRSILYSARTYATVNVPSGRPQSFYEADHVS